MAVLLEGEAMVSGGSRVDGGALSADRELTLKVPEAATEPQRRPPEMESRYQRAKVELVRLRRILRECGAKQSHGVEGWRAADGPQVHGIVEVMLEPGSTDGGHCWNREGNEQRRRSQGDRPRWNNGI